MTIARYKWIGFLLALMAVAIALRFTLLDTSPMLVGIVVAAICVITVPILAKDWTRFDEASREAQKTSWFWGASVGIGLIGAALALMRTSGHRFSQLAAIGPMDPLGYFTAGAFAVMLAQGCCYLIFWAAWWISKR